MPGRAFSAENAYRYGFNGKENDKDISEGAQDYGLRVYDSRIAKFLSVDPLSSKYAYYSPYHFAGNTPIMAIDRDGGEPEDVRGILRARDAESRIWAKDPEHAAERIRELNKHAFLFVAGMLTGGSGRLFMAFTDLLALYGSYEFIKGVAKKDEKQIREGINDLTMAATGHLGGHILGKIFNRISGAVRINAETGQISISLGKNVNLKGFAEKTNTLSYHSWDEIPNRIEVKGTFMNFEESFEYATQAVLNTKGKILFNLEFVNLNIVKNIKPGTGLMEPLEQLGGKSLWESGYITEWEMSKVLNSKILSSVAEFRKMGVTIPIKNIRSIIKKG